MAILYLFLDSFVIQSFQNLFYLNFRVLFGWDGPLFSVMSIFLILRNSFYATPFLSSFLNILLFPTLEFCCNHSVATRIIIFGMYGSFLMQNTMLIVIFLNFNFFAYFWSISMCFSPKIGHKMEVQKYHYQHSVLRQKIAVQTKQYNSSCYRMAAAKFKSWKQ